MKAKRLKDTCVISFYHLLLVAMQPTTTSLEAKTINEKVLELCKEIWTDWTIQMFKKQLYRARTYCKKAETKEIMDKYMSDINRLETSIRIAWELNIKREDSKNYTSLQNKIKEENAKK